VWVLEHSQVTCLAHHSCPKDLHAASCVLDRNRATQHGLTLLLCTAASANTPPAPPPPSPCQPQHLNSPTAQQPNSPTPQHLNSTTARRRVMRRRRLGRGGARAGRRRRGGRRARPRGPWSRGTAAARSRCTAASPQTESQTQRLGGH